MLHAADAPAATEPQSFCLVLWLVLLSLYHSLMLKHIFKDSTSCKGKNGAQKYLTKKKKTWVSRAICVALTLLSWTPNSLALMLYEITQLEAFSEKTIAWNLFSLPYHLNSSAGASTDIRNFGGLLRPWGHSWQKPTWASFHRAQ